jgi:hypothetical protein
MKLRHARVQGFFRFSRGGGGNLVAILAIRSTHTSQNRQGALFLEEIDSGWVGSTEATREQKMLKRVTCQGQVLQRLQGNQQGAISGREHLFWLS